MRTVVYIIVLAATVVAVLGLLITDPFFNQLRTLVKASVVVSERALFAESSSELKYGGAYGLVSVLDDYSTWHDRRSDTLIRRQARGHYGGFGIEIVRYDDTTLIWQVFPESPAREAGLKMGDRLLSADTLELLGLALDSVHTVLQSIPQPEVNLTVYRPGSGNIHVISCKRRQIEVGTVNVWDRRDGLAYLAIGTFNGRTFDALERAMDTLRNAGVERFILDLRSNPGGLLNAAVDCAELFMPREGTIVKVSGAGPSEEIAAGRGPYPTEPLVILVNEFSASGSELLAGCLQDWDRAVIVGSPTYGKGFVQNLFPLQDRSSLRLTVGRYLTPSGRTFYKPDSTQQTDTTHYRSLVNGRPLVGGGQIYPDIETGKLSCPDHLVSWAHGRGTFEFAVELLSRPKLPPLNRDLIEEFWHSRHNRYDPPLSAEFAELIPAASARSNRWQRIQSQLLYAESTFDQVAAADCFLFVLVRHLIREGTRIPLLEEPLLSTDPVLSVAVNILETPGAYQEIITGMRTTGYGDRVRLQ